MRNFLLICVALMIFLVSAPAFADDEDDYNDE